MNFVRRRSFIVANHSAQNSAILLIERKEEREEADGKESDLALFVLLLAGLPDGIQNFPIGVDRLGVDKDESHHTRLGATVDPIVDRPALDEHVARF